jgi:hypothetical protein
MSQLRHLGITPGWIYECVVCTMVEGSPHASPAGVWTHDLRALSMDLYDTSRTLPALLAAGEYVVDLPADAGTFFRALHDPATLRFGRASVVAAPCLADATATIELTVEEVTPHDGRTLVTGLVRHVTTRGGVRLINRAEGLLVESLIAATRAGLRSQEDTLALLAENARVAEKVAPGSSFAVALARLRDALARES